MLSTTPLGESRSHRERRRGVGTTGLLAAILVAALVLFAGNAVAAQSAVGLGAANGFAVLAGTTVTSAGPSVLGGDLGVSPGTAVTGFRPPGTVSGTIHAGGPPASQAQAALTSAYNDAASRTPATAVPADLGGSTLTPGVYRSGSSLGLTGALTLDGRGDPNAVFVFQAASTLTTASASAVNLVNGAQACNVFWQVGSSATLGTSSAFAGNILAATSITITTGVAVNGRALARTGAVTLDSDTITTAHCAPPTTGGGTTGGGGTGGGGATGYCAPSQSASTARTSRASHGDKRLPVRPMLLSPRAGARVAAGIVRFSWRPAARAAGYALIVDHHRMNTGCLTRAAMLVRAGSHRYRVIAMNRYGERSSRFRGFEAHAAAQCFPGYVNNGPDDCVRPTDPGLSAALNTVFQYFNFPEPPQGSRFDVERTRNGGFLLRRPGSTGSAETIRYGTDSEGPYLRYYNERGQPLDPRAGKPPGQVTRKRFRELTHIRHGYRGPFKGLPRWYTGK